MSVVESKCMTIIRVKSRLRVEIKDAKETAIQFEFVNFKEKFNIFKPKHDFELPQDNCTARPAKSPKQS